MAGCKPRKCRGGKNKATPTTCHVKPKGLNAAEKLHRLLCILICISSFCFFLTSGAVPQIAQTVGVNVAYITYVKMASGIIALFTMLFVGVFWDRLGRKRITMIGLGIFVLTLILTLLATYAWPVAYAVAALAGFVHILQVLVGWVGVIVCTPDGRMKMAFGQALGAWAFGMLLGIIIQPFLMAQLGIRTVLAICACIMAVVLLVVAMVLPDDAKSFEDMLKKLLKEGLCTTTIWRECGACEWLTVLILIDMPLVVFRRAFDSTGQQAYSLSDEQLQYFTIVFLSAGVIAKFFVLPGVAQKSEKAMSRIQSCVMCVMLVGFCGLALAFDFITVTAAAGTLHFCVSFLVPAILVHLIWSSNVKNWGELGRTIAVFFLAMQLIRLIANFMAIFLVEFLGLQSIAFLGFICTCMAIYMHAQLTGFVF